MLVQAQAPEVTKTAEVLWSRAAEFGPLVFVLVTILMMVVLVLYAGYRFINRQQDLSDRFYERQVIAQEKSALAMERTASGMDKVALVTERIDTTNKHIDETLQRVVDLSTRQQRGSRHILEAVRRLVKNDDPTIISHLDKAREALE